MQVPVGVFVPIAQLDEHPSSKGVDVSSNLSGDELVVLAAAMASKANAHSSILCASVMSREMYDKWCTVHYSEH